MTQQIVLGEKDKFDFLTTLNETKILDEPEQLKQEQEENVVYILSVKDKNSHFLSGANNKVYVPYIYLHGSHQENDDVYIYFDLENYPFFKKVKSVITKQEKPKGVFRYRRMTNTELSHSLIAGDLFVISSLFGRPEDIHVKQSSSNATRHIILSVDFGGGQLAHIEYTQSIHEKIEMEWSGIKQIIEFDSDEVTPVQPGNHTSLPLSYSVDSVLHTAYKVDKNILDRLQKYIKMLGGGVE